jgi:hypothetical protein
LTVLRLEKSEKRVLNALTTSAPLGSSGIAIELPDERLTSLLSILGPNVEASSVVAGAYHRRVAPKAAQTIVKVVVAFFEVAVGFGQLISNLVGVPLDLCSIIVNNVRELSVHGSGQKEKKGNEYQLVHVYP